MARPVKYKNEQEFDAAAERTAGVIREIKGSRKWTYEELSNRLAEHRLIIHSSILRSYSSGIKPVGEARLHRLAEIAVAEGWAGEKCMQVWLFNNPEHQRSLKKLNSALVKGRAALEVDLLRSLKNLVGAGYAQHQIESLVCNDLEKLRPCFVA